MNIFYLDTDPCKAAMMMADKHVVKMILESAQLLCTAHHILDGSAPESFYKATHVNHPSAKWVRESQYHYNWLLAHLNALLAEYTHRYEKIHKVERTGLNTALERLPTNIPYTSVAKPAPCCMPPEFIKFGAVFNYREYYRVAKAHLHSWKKRSPPNWI